MGRGLSELQKMILKLRYKVTEIEDNDDWSWWATKCEIWEEYFNTRWRHPEYQNRKWASISPSVSRAISRLEDRGLIRSLRSGWIRSCIVLTKEGLKLAKEPYEREHRDKYG